MLRVGGGYYCQKTRGHMPQTKFSIVEKSVRVWFGNLMKL